LPPEDIYLLRIVQAIEGDSFGQGCLLGLPACGSEDPCPLHDRWEQIQGSVMDMLERTRLNDLPEVPVGL
jgi:DNA-binding IscR family transcriptional regulator